MRNTMTKAQMAEMIERMSAEIEALKAEKESAPAVPASTKQTATKGKAKTSTKSTAKSEKESVPVLPVRKGKTVGFDGWLNHKVWVFNKNLMTECGGKYDRATRTINFPTAKSAESFCKGFVPVLTDTQYEESKKAIDDGFKARKAEREKATAEAKTPKESAPKKSGLIAKSAKAKKGATGEPVKKPEWRERAERGEKPFSNYSTYKEYWHAVIGK